MADRSSSPRVGFDRWARIVAAATSVVLLVFGVLSVFKTAGGAASTALIVVGGVLGYVALANDRIREVSASGVSFFEQESADLVEQALTSPDTPAVVQEYFAERFEPHLSALPREVRREVRAATERTAQTKSEILAELCGELGIDQLPISKGSTLPVAVFHAAARALDVSDAGSMPVVARRVVEAAGGTWAAADWSRGSTVTLSGLQKVLDAVRSHNRAGGSTAA